MVLLWSTPAQAQPAEALDHFQAAQDHYAAGRYREALADLQAALAVDPNSPTLNFNAGRVSELLGQVPQALNFYRRAERLLPDAENEERERLQGAIRRLEGAQTEVQPLVPEQAPPTLREYQNEHGVVDEVFYAAVVTSGVCLVAAILVGVQALGAKDAASNTVLERDGDWERRLDLEEETQSLSLASDILFGATAAAGLAAVLLYALREKHVYREMPQEQEEEPWIYTSRTGFVGGVRGRW